MKTYSPGSVRLYRDMVVEAEKTGRNLEEECLRNTILKYGYKSLEDAEARM